MNLLELEGALFLQSIFLPAFVLSLVNESNLILKTSHSIFFIFQLALNQMRSALNSQFLLQFISLHLSTLFVMIPSWASLALLKLASSIKDLLLRRVVYEATFSLCTFCKKENSFGLTSNSCLIY